MSCSQGVESESEQLPVGMPTGAQRMIFSKDEVDSGMPSKKLVIPSFQNEGEEAAWWEKHRVAVEAELRASRRAGKTIPFGDILVQAKKTKELQPVTIRWATEDIATARQLADRKGVGYQTYIKLLLHETLQKEAGRQLRIRK